MTKARVLAALGILVLGFVGVFVGGCAGPEGDGAPEPVQAADPPPAWTSHWDRSHVSSADGHRIAYTAGGSGEPALVFVHCGFCDQGVWAGRLEAAAEHHRVVALDLAGHGDSAPVRPSATRASFAEDVRAVADALGLQRMILVGSSFGGVVALDTAALLPDRVVGIVAIDTLHDLTAEWDQEAWRERVEAFRSDFDGSCAAMLDQLFHPAAAPALRKRVDRLMCGSPPELAQSVFGAFDGYDWTAAARAAGVPIVAIQGDLYPTAVEANRTVVPGYEAVILEGIGHFPMLEAPELFDRHLAEAVTALGGSR